MAAFPEETAPPPSSNPPASHVFLSGDTPGNETVLRTLRPEGDPRVGAARGFRTSRRKINQGLRSGLRAPGALWNLDLGARV
eukprot:5748405-Pyramimonas_sp.AAC.1